MFKLKYLLGFIYLAFTNAVFSSGEIRACISQEKCTTKFLDSPALEVGF